MARTKLTYKSFVGIDPGKSGGISVVTPGQKLPVMVWRMPDTIPDIVNLLSRLPKESVCVLEKVGAMPGQSPKSMFTFGEAYGAIQAAMYAAGIPYRLVTPQKWQGHFQMGRPGSGAAAKREHKRKLKERAQQLFPDVKVTLEIADSLLLAQYVRDTFQEESD